MFTYICMCLETEYKCTHHFWDYIEPLVALNITYYGNNITCQI